MRTTLSFFLATIATFYGCASDASAKPEEQDAPTDGKLDGRDNLIDHGAFDLAVGDDVAELSETERVHAWTLTLSGPATIFALTDDPRGAAMTLDTVLYLYEQKPDGGWGRYIRRNDDGDYNMPGSSIQHEVTQATTLRVVVKGYDREALGSFRLGVTCSGFGCDAAEHPTSECGFAEDIEIWTSLTRNQIEGFTVRELDSIDLDGPLTDVERDRILAVVKVRYRGLSTFEDARNALASNVMPVYEITGPSGTFEACAVTINEPTDDFGSVDYFVGAIFRPGSAQPVATIDEEFIYCE